MEITRILAQMAVTDLDRGADWYRILFGREPDLRPMDGLVEWHLAPTFGLQLWVDADRAGHATIVADHDDLDGLAQQLARTNLSHEPIQEVTSSRILQVADPDGNRLIFSGPKAD